MHRHVFALACLFGGAGWSSAASPDPGELAIPAEIQVKSRQLVERLGSDDFPEREDAEQQLANLGRLARPAIFAGANTSPNPEVRLRCSQLLPKATALDLKARLDTFLADTEGKYEHDLPAWKTFRSVVCREWTFFGYSVWSDRSLEKAAREVFTDLISAHANRRLLLAIDGSRVELTELVTARKQELVGQRFPRDDAPLRSPTLEEVTALLFADSRVGSQYLPRRGYSVTFLLSGSGFTQAARGEDAKARVYRAIAAAWLDSRNEPREMSQVMSVATELGLNDQVCGLAARLLTMPGVTTMFRGRAASNLAYYGTKKHIPLLEKSLTNANVVYTARSTFPGSPDATYEIQARDVALAISLLLAEQKLEDYGLTDRTGGVGTRSSYSYTRYYFEDDATRKKAFEKWTEWRKKHVDE
jgi:hypothetical protein